MPTRYKNNRTGAEAKCIGCGCTDSKACVTSGLFGGTCFWVLVDRKKKIGVCSSCNKPAIRAKYDKMRKGKK